MILLSTLAVGLVLGALSTTSDEWPGWRGPGGNGIGRGSPPIEWSEERNVRWKAPLPGKGNSSPVVWGGRVYVTSAVPTGNRGEPREPSATDGGGRRDPRLGDPVEEQDLVVLAFEADDGSLAWRTVVERTTPHKGTHPNGSYATPTPAVDGRHIVASFGSYGIYALSMEGELVWKTTLGPMEIAEWTGEGSSPVLHGDTLVVNWDHNGDSFLLALDAHTGAERWRSARRTRTTWSTPQVVEVGGRAQVVVGAGRLTGYALDDGAELWSYGAHTKKRGGAVASPVCADGRLVAVSASMDGELRAVRLADATGDLEDSAALLWLRTGDMPHAPSPLAYGGRVYVLKANSAILTVRDLATGAVLHGPERLPHAANVFASPVLAAGRLYVLDRDGTTEVLAVEPELRHLASNELEDVFFASPAIAHDALFLRGRASLYCLGEDSR